MKNNIKNDSFNILIIIIGIGIIVAGILTMALYHDMSWQSYVIIGVIMGIALWGIIKSIFNISPQKHITDRDKRHFR